MSAEKKFRPLLAPRPKAVLSISPRKRRRTMRASPGSRRFNNVSEGDSYRRVVGPSFLPGGFTSIWSKAVAQPDTFIVKMRYETTSAFTSTAGAASYVQVKGNSIYRPYVGNTDSVGGYSRMYADYEYAEVMSSKITVRLWGGVSGQDEPFRLVVIPCTPTQYSTYSGFSNVAQLWDVPHATQKLFSPGGVLPTLVSRGTNAQILFGQSEEIGAEFAAGGVTSYGATTGTDPTSLWYYLIGYQNMAGTTTTNQQAQVSVEYQVRYIRPIATPVQVSLNKWGNDSTTCESKSLRGAPSLEVERKEVPFSSEKKLETPQLLVRLAQTPAAGQVRGSTLLSEREYELVEIPRKPVGEGAKS